MRYTQWHNISLVSVVFNYFLHEFLKDIGSIGKGDIDLKSAKFAAILAKPVKPTQLFEVIARVITRNSIIQNKVYREAEENYKILPTHPLRILIAEDNVINQKVALKFLRSLDINRMLRETALKFLKH